jgi:predicted nucleic acid-binding protein
MTPRVAVSDAGPIHYLALVGHIDVLPQLFEEILIPSQVQAELSRATTPTAVREFIANPPAWFKIVSDVTELTAPALHSGEAAALQLAIDRKCEILVDDQAARAAARRLGFTPIGTVAILCRAADDRLIDLQTAINRLRNTNFYISPAILEQALKRK